MKTKFCILTSVFCVLLLFGCRQPPMTIKGDLYFVPAGVEVTTVEGKDEIVTIITTKKKMLLMSRSYFEYYWDGEWE